MNEELKKLKAIEDKTFNTSDVIKDSFVSLLEKAKTEDYVVLKNNRKKQTLIVSELESSIGLDIRKVDNNKSKKAFRSAIKENTYFLMRFESENITFPDVETIIDTTNPELTKAGFEVEVTRDLMNAWKYVVFTPFSISLDVDYVIKINELTALHQALEVGKLRSGKVTVSGTNYSPTIPKRIDLEKLVNEARDKSNANAYATLLVKMIKAQMFWDGNKRTAFLTVARLLIESDKGTLSLKEKDFLEFNKLLNDYYNDKSDKIIVFTANNIINLW